MKKLLVGLFVLSSVASFAMGKNNSYVKFGVDVGSKFSYDDGGINFPKEAKGYGLFFEDTINVNENTEIGIGLGYIKRESKKASFYLKEDGFFIDTIYKFEGDAPFYNSIPFYLIWKYNFNSESSFKPYIKADLGYSFNRGNYTISNGIQNVTAQTDDGLYAGIGFGFEYKYFVADLSYVHTGGKYKWSNGTTDKINNRTARLSLGFKF